MSDEEERKEAPAAVTTPPTDDDEVDPVFVALWNRVLEAWDDDKPHQAILQHALEKQLLPQLAGRYRALKDDPARGPRAEKKMNAIVAAATQLLFATKTPTRTKTPWQWTLAAAIAFTMVVGWLAYALFGRR